MHYRIKSSKYGDTIKLDVYKDRYSLQAAREDGEGKIWPQWVHPQGKNKTIIETAIPLAVGKLEKPEMIDMLKHFLNLLEGRTDEHGTINTTPSVNDSETPF